MSSQKAEEGVSSVTAAPKTARSARSAGASKLSDMEDSLAQESKRRKIDDRPFSSVTESRRDSKRNREEVGQAPFVVGFISKSRNIKQLTLENYKTVRYIVRYATRIGGAPDADHKYSEFTADPQMRRILENYLKLQNIHVRCV